MDRRATDLTEVLKTTRALDGSSDSVVDGPIIDLLAHSLQTAAILDAEGAEDEVIAAGLELHIPAKAFLATTDDDYRRRLSPGSRASLDLQGGSLDTDAQDGFLHHESSLAALTFRRADDRAKDPNAVVPNLAHWKPLLRSLSTTRP